MKTTTERAKRTKQETIEYFKHLSCWFEVESHRLEAGGRLLDAAESHGKAEAYGLAAFELERNME